MEACAPVHGGADCKLSSLCRNFSPRKQAGGTCGGLVASLQGAAPVGSSVPALGGTTSRRQWLSLKEPLSFCLGLHVLVSRGQLLYAVSAKAWILTDALISQEGLVNS